VQDGPVSTDHPGGVPQSPQFGSVEDVTERLAAVGYLASTAAATTVYLADRLGKPLLIEGPAGVGKTELAKAVSRATGADLVRLQCYEGLDEARALYEWNYKKQLLRIQADREHERDWETVESDIFSEQFLLTRPLLEAIRADEPVVLLIDEVDRVEIETEALLLEVLSDFQVSIPELGTIVGKQRPFVFLTSNNTRELSEALKRRCLYLHIDYPTVEREREIRAFVSKEYWTITANLSAHLPPAFDARLQKFLGKNLEIENNEQSQEIVRQLEHARWIWRNW